MRENGASMNNPPGNLPFHDIPLNGKIFENTGLKEL
jgi:hypothetical protein